MLGAFIVCGSMSVLNRSTLAAQEATTSLSSVNLEDTGQAHEERQQDNAISIGQRLTIKSECLQQEREYLVYLPESYHSKQYLPQSYPVLFLFDGNVQFHLVTGMVSFMAESGWQVPEMIVVGIPHVNRTKELTPTHTNNDFRTGKTSAQLDESGGGDDFLHFVTQELIPKIDADYRTKPYRILFGHSYGGLLAAHAFLENDDAFQAFILADPSLWWDDRLLVRRLKQRIADKQQIADKQLTGKNRAVFISRVATYRAPGDLVLQRGFDNIEASIRAFEEPLEASDIARFRSRQFTAETHHSVPTQTLYHGLLHVFDGYELPQEFFLGFPDKIEHHFKSVSELVGLELRPREQLIDMWGNAFLTYDEDFRRHAIPLFELNRAHYPSSPNVHVSLGKAYQAEGDIERARESYAKALVLDPDNEAAKAGLENL